MINKQNGQKFIVDFCAIFDYNENRKRIKTMPNVEPVSALRNYGEVLLDVAVGRSVFLTKNGRGDLLSART